MRNRSIWIAVAAAVIVLAGGGFYLTRGRPAAQPQRARDPGLAVVLAIRTLEREPQTRLSKEQIAKILPFIKALKDVPPSDEAAAVIARAVRETFTPQQQAALEEARLRFQERARGQGAQAGPPPGGGFGGGGGDGEGGGGAAAERSRGRAPGPDGAGSAISDEQRAQFRTRAFERMIRYLERRSN